MEATRLVLANGVVRVVMGRAKDVGAALKRRTMSEDDRIRQFKTVDGDVLTVNADAVAMTEAAEVRAERAFGFARALAA